MRQPLIIRPGYGQGHPATPVAESGLPEGPPAGKGVSLDPSIPGTSTFNKPVNDVREERKDDEPLDRIEDADDLAKSRGRIDTREDSAHADIGYTRPGGPDPDNHSISKYPYRDGIPNTHNASRDAKTADCVVQLWLLRNAHVMPLTLGHSVRVATRLDEILRGLNPKILQRAKTCSISLKRVDTKNLRWLFSVDCGNGAKIVRLHAKRDRNSVKLGKMDLTISCSCEAWRWLGSEHHSKREDYLDGRPRGTATPPVIKDPSGINRVCKHVAGVIAMIRDWEIPIRK